MNVQRIDSLSVVDAVYQKLKHNFTVFKCFLVLIYFTYLFESLNINLREYNL